MKILGNKSYVVYNKQDWQKLLLILWPHLSYKFTDRLINLANIKNAVYIRIVLNSIDELDFDGCGQAIDYATYNPSTITKIDCKDGLPDWITNL